MISVTYESLYRVGWVDPATAEHAKRHGARSAVVVVGGDDHERRYILYAQASHQAPHQLMERIFEVDSQFKCNTFGIDATGTQSMYAAMVNREGRQRGLRTRLKMVGLHDEKIFRIESVLRPLCAEGRLFRSDQDTECWQLKEELSNFPSGKYNDILDALACAIRLLPTALPEQMKRMTEDQLKRYLERTGVGDQVQFRLAQQRGAR